MKINQIYNENCIQTMNNMSDDFIDLTVTSPPYDNLRDYKGYKFDFRPIAKELFRVTKPGGVVVWIVGDSIINGSETGTSFRQALYFKGIGFNIHDTMIYSKLNYVPLTHNRYEQMFEYMFIFSKGRPKAFNPILIKTKEHNRTIFRNGLKAKTLKDEKNYSTKFRNKTTIIKEYKIKGNIFEYAVGFNDKTKHPAPFPEELVSDHIVSWSNKGDLIYDPFMGSGTTAKMAILNERNYIGSEISEEYCTIIQERLRPTILQDKYKLF